MRAFFSNWKNARLVSSLAALLVLGACGALPSAPVSDSLAATRVSKGEPMAQYALPDGQRLFYKLRPGEIERLDFDASGARVGRQMALSRAAFAGLAKTGGDLASVQLAFGPAGKRSSQEDGGLTWEYSWFEYDVWRVARVSFAKSGAFQRVDVIEDPVADDRYR